MVETYKLGMPVGACSPCQEWHSLLAMPPLNVVYRLGQKSVARVGGLLCFERVEDAVDFCDLSSNVVLLKCEASEPVVLPNLSLVIPADRVHRAEMLWRGEVDGDLPLPSGTRAYRWVTPIHVVTRPEEG